MAISLSDESVPKVPARHESSENVLKVGVIGYGYWGPNIVRNFHGQERSRVVAVCDKSPKSLQRVRMAFPEMPTTSDFNELLTSPEIDAIAVVTPVWTHFELAKTALENGKHVFVEKPFTCTTAQAVQIDELRQLDVFPELDVRSDRDEFVHSWMIFPFCWRDWSAASSIRTTCNPATPSLNGVLSFMMQSTK